MEEKQEKSAIIEALMWIQYSLLICFVLFVHFISFMFFVVLMVPSIFNMFLILMSYTHATKFSSKVFYYMMAISDYPSFVLYIDILFQMVKSFFTKLSEILESGKIMKVLTEKISSKHPKYILMRIQLVVLDLFIIFEIWLLGYEYVMSEIGTSGYIIIIIGLIPPFYGIGKVLYSAWAIFWPFKKQDEYAKESEIGMQLESIKDENSETEKEDTSFFLLSADILDPAELRNHEVWDSYFRTIKQKSQLSKSSLFSVRGIINVLYTIILVGFILFCLEYIVANPSSFITNIWHPVILVLSFPYSVACNLTIGFPAKEEDLKGTIKSSSRIVLLLYLVFGIFTVIASFVISGLTPPIIQSLDYYNNTGNTYNVSMKQPIYCDVKIPGGMDLIQILGLALTTKLYDFPANPNIIAEKNVPIFTNMMKYLFGEDYAKLNISGSAFLSRYPSTVYTSSIDPNVAIVVIGSMERVLDWALLIEAFAKNYLADLFDNLIPFFSYGSMFFEKQISFLSQLWRALTNKYFIHDSLSSDLLDQAKRLQKNYSTIILVGHLIGGTFVKDIAYRLGAYGFSFDSPVAGASFADFLETLFSQNSVLSSKHLVNFYTDSFFGSNDDGFDNNIKIKSIVDSKIPSLDQIFCSLAASCYKNDHLIHMCNEILSLDGENGTQIFANAIQSEYE